MRRFHHAPDTAFVFFWGVGGGAENRVRQDFGEIEGNAVVQEAAAGLRAFVSHRAVSHHCQFEIAQPRSVAQGRDAACLGGQQISVAIVIPLALRFARAPPRIGVLAKPAFVRETEIADQTAVPPGVRAIGSHAQRACGNYGTRAEAGTLFVTPLDDFIDVLICQRGLLRNKLAFAFRGKKGFLTDSPGCNVQGLIGQRRRSGEDENDGGTARPENLMKRSHAGHLQQKLLG